MHKSAHSKVNVKRDYWPVIETLEKNKEIFYEEEFYCLKITI